MTKRAAMVIASGLVAALMAGMVGATRQAAHQGGPVIVRTVAGPAVVASPVPSRSAGDVEHEG